LVAIAQHIFFFHWLLSVAGPDALCLGSCWMGL